MFPALSLIVGNLWYRVIKLGENKKELKISNYINSIMFFVISLLGLVFSYTYKMLLPDNIEFYIDNALVFARPALVYMLIISILFLFFVKKNKIVSSFICHIAIMLGVVWVGCDFGIPYYTSFAQDELEEFAQFINLQRDSQTVTYGFSAKYSILNNKKKIKYIITPNRDNFDELVKYVKNNKKRNVYILTRTKIKDLDNKKEFKKVKEGKVYVIYVDTLH